MVGQKPRLRGLWVLFSLGLLAGVLSGCGMAYITEEPIVRPNVFAGFSGRVVDAESGDGVGNAKVSVRPTAQKGAQKDFYIYSMGDGAFQLANYKENGVSTPFKQGEEYQIVISSINHRIKEFKINYEGAEQKLGAVELLRVQEGGRVEMVIPGKEDLEKEADVPPPVRMGPPVP